MMPVLLAALSWEPQIKGALYVVVSVVVLCGSVQLLLSTNLGARLGFQVAAAGLFGLMTVMGIMWWAYAIGPVGVAPTWDPQQVIEGDIARSIDPSLGFPAGWRELEPGDPEVADAQPVVDGSLVSVPGETGGVFASASEYQVVRAFETGGETYGPLGLDFRPFNLFHRPRYLVVEVEPSSEVSAEVSGDSYSVVMIRNLGSERLNPAVFTIASGLLFGVFIYQLHLRDKRLMVARASAAESRADAKELASTKS